MPDLFPLEKPFTALFAGHTMCGKTHLMKQYLNSFLTQKTFDYWFIFSSTLHLNKDYDEYEENKDPKNGRQLIQKYRTNIESEIQEVIREQEQQVELNEDDAPDVLMVVEDTAGTKMLMFLGMLDNFSIKSRHFKISIFITTQRITAIGRTIRCNCKYFILFHCSNFSELERFLTEMVSRRHRKTVEAMLDEIYSEAYQYIVVDNFQPKHFERLYINGKTLLTLPREVEKK